jgi:RNA polymerase sigma-70 factor (ECF subfamily)
VHELLQEQPAVDPRAEAEYAQEFRRRAFQWAADRVKNDFTNTTWQAFWKTGVENQSIAEVAGELGLSEGAVYIARCRVLSRLRHKVEELSSDIDLPEGDSVDGRPI